MTAEGAREQEGSITPKSPGSREEGRVIKDEAPAVCSVCFCCVSHFWTLTQTRMRTRLTHSRLACVYGGVLYQLSSHYIIIMIQSISINTGSVAGSPGSKLDIRQTRVIAALDAHRTSTLTLISLAHLLIVSLIDLSPSGTLLLQHSPAIALMRCLCCRCVYVCLHWCVCLRKKDVSDPCGPVYLHPCVGVEGGQRQGCLYPSPFPRLLSHRHSGHRRMKRLWIFSPPPYTHQSRKIRQKMSTAWPIQSSFKPNTGGI